MVTTGEPPPLQLGDSGDWVIELKRMLQTLDYPAGEPDANFDDGTAQAVQSFRVSVGLGADGMVDEATWAALLSRLPPAVTTIDQVPDAQDGWIWDGERWIAAVEEVATGELSAGELSPDQRWRWDGSGWEPAAGT